MLQGSNIFIYLCSSSKSKDIIKDVSIMCVWHQFCSQVSECIVGLWQRGRHTVSPKYIFRVYVKSFIITDAINI